MVVVEACRDRRLHDLQLAIQRIGDLPEIRGQHPSPFQLFKQGPSTGERRRSETTTESGAFHDEPSGTCVRDLTSLIIAVADRNGHNRKRLFAILQNSPGMTAVN